MAVINFPNFLGPAVNAFEEFVTNFSAQWGIFDENGNSFTGLGQSFIGAIQSVETLGYNKSTMVSDFPVENGGFASYNKVEMPGLIAVTLSITGGSSDRTQFITEIERAINETSLFTVTTPEIQYLDYTIERYNYIRTSRKNVTMLSVELFMKQIRQVSVFTTANGNNIVNPTNPSSSSVREGGQVQARDAAQSTVTAVTNGVS